jgi:flagellin
MGFRIRSNAMSARALRQLGSHTNTVGTSTTKLASGKRINFAKDDAAGLSISENLRAKVRSLNAAKRNSLDGLSILEVAEAGFQETSNMLIRLKQLAVQASSDTVGGTQRQYLDREFTTLKQEIDRISAAVEFNGVRLIGGHPNPPPNQMQGIPNNKTDYPLEFQIDSNYYEKADAVTSHAPVNVVRFNTKNLVAYTSGHDSLNIGEGQDGARLNSKKAAHDSLAKLDFAIKRVNKHRSFLGSTQNQLKHVLNVLDIKIESGMESGSRIADTDMAAESSQYVRSKMQQSAATSVLSSANVQSEVALGLLDRTDPRNSLILKSIIHKQVR